MEGVNIDWISGKIRALTNFFESDPVALSRVALYLFCTDTVHPD